MNGTIGLLATLAAALTLSACANFFGASGPSVVPADTRVIGQTLVRESPRLGESVDNAECPARQTLICTDNGFWARCQCSG